jgi:hypothetical protein
MRYVPKRRNATKFNLLQELSRMDDAIKNPEMILGTSSLTFPTQTSSQRVSMFVKHVSQFMVLNNPEFPRVFSGNENLYGDLSSYYHQVKHRSQVVKVFKKFNTDHVQVIFVKDMVTGEYDVIERMEAKPFTEVFGFAFNNDRLDNVEENQVIEEGTILSRSTGYDEYNNHCMGVNAKTLFSFNPNLTEDAALMLDEFAERVSFNKIHTISINIPTQNMIPLNIHGDAKTYKIIPDIGEQVGQVLCAIRPVAITQMADLDNEKLRYENKLLDKIYTTKGEIIDINIYTNTPFLEDSNVYDQMRKYHEMQRVYYKKIYEFCQSIKRYPRTQRLKTLYSVAMDHANEDAVWVDNNIVKSVRLEITTKETCKLTEGQKITGRYGNKSVISMVLGNEDTPVTVVPRSRMPLMPDGTPVELMVNALSANNRNIAFALIELCINSMSTRFVNHIKNIKDVDKQYEMLEHFISTINKSYWDELTESAKKLKINRKAFVDECISTNIHMKIESFDTSLTLRDSILSLYKEFPNIFVPYHLLVWSPYRNEYVKTILPCIVDDTYMIVLKQDGVKGASSRGAGGVSPEGLPIKSNAKRDYMADMSDTAVKLGEYDRLTFNIGVTNEDLITYFMLMRSAVEGRGWLEKSLYDPDLPLPEKFENRPVRINNCYMKVLGFSVDLVPRQNQLVIPSKDTLRTYTFRNTSITISEFDMYYMHKIALRYDKIRKKELKKDHEYDNMDLWNYAFKDTDYPTDWLDDSLKRILIEFVDDILLTNK